MRDIKFRIWRYQDSSKQNKMYYADKMMMGVNSGAHLVFPTDGNYKYFDDGIFDAKDQIVMQYTGLKDKNDKEIYEGDILRMVLKDCNDTDFNQDSVVVFSKGCFVGKIIRCKVFKKDSETYFSSYSHEYEIIGNIHEKPELL